jgi:hypothetical protein
MGFGYTLAYASVHTVSHGLSLILRLLFIKQFSVVPLFRKVKQGRNGHLNLL